MEIPISLIEYNDFFEGRRSNIEDITSAFLRQGQLSPICVRKHPSKRGKFQVIFGNRRLAAAQKLGWKTIAAKVVDAKDSNAILMAFSENVDRRDFTDYEKAIVLKQLHDLTGYTYNQIASYVGKSPAFVSQHVAMLQLFPPSVASERQRDTVLNSLTENHCRILARIAEPEERWNTAKLVVSAGLGVRELQKICARIRKSDDSDIFQAEPSSERRKTDGIKERERDVAALRRMVTDIISGLNARDIRPFVESIDPRHFVMFPGFSMSTVIDANTLSDYLSEVLRHATKYKLISPRHVDVRFAGMLAYVAVILREEVTASFTKAETIARVTFIFEKREENNWKMVHVHWSLASPLDLGYKPFVAIKEALRP